MIILIIFGDQRLNSNIFLQSQVLTMKGLITCSSYLFCCRRKLTSSSEISRALFIQVLNCCDSSTSKEAPQYCISIEHCGSKDGFVTTQTYCCFKSEGDSPVLCLVRCAARRGEDGQFGELVEKISERTRRRTMVGRN
jgi:hypothetical protein